MRILTGNHALMLGLAALVVGCTGEPERLQAPTHVDSANLTGGVVGPVAQFILPTSGAYNQYPPIALFRWDSYDTRVEIGDLPETPAFFEYKLVEIESILFDTDDDIIDALLFEENLLSEDGSSEWIRVPATMRELLVERGSDEHLTFAVRAVSADGVVEPDLDRGRNFIPFIQSAVQPRPFVYVYGGREGLHRFPGNGDAWEITVAPNIPIFLRWEIDATHYGYFGGDSNYALDVPDPDDESSYDPNGIGGWVGWERRDELVTPIVFDTDDAGTDHVLYLKARDYSQTEESTRLCEIRIHVANLTFEKWAAVIDDAKFAILPPSDDDHDAFVHENVARRLHDFGEVDDIAIYTPQGNLPERRRAREIPLETLGQYKVLVWSTNTGVPIENATGLWLNQNNLAAYLAAGGRLFIVGDRLTSQIVTRRGNFSYPKLEEDIPTFVRSYLRYEDDIVSVPTDENAVSQEVSGMVGATPLVSGFPQLELDIDKRDPSEIINDGERYRGGIVSWEAVWPDFYESEGLPGFEPLYTVDTFNEALCCGPLNSGLEGAYVAHRFESPIEEWENSRWQGRTVVFNFQPWWFEADQVQAASDLAVEWLIEGLDPGAGPRAITGTAAREVRP